MEKIDRNSLTKSDKTLYSQLLDELDSLRSQLVDKQSECNLYKVELNQASDENTRLNAELAQVRGENSELKRENERLKKENHHYFMGEDKASIQARTEAARECAKIATDRSTWIGVDDCVAGMCNLIANAIKQKFQIEG